MVERTCISRHRGKKPLANYADRFTPGERNRNELPTYKVRVSLYSKKRYARPYSRRRLTLYTACKLCKQESRLRTRSQCCTHAHGAIRCTFAPPLSIRQVVFGRSYRSITAKERCTPHARDTPAIYPRCCREADDVLCTGIQHPGLGKSGIWREILNIENFSRTGMSRER